MACLTEIGSVILGKMKILKVHTSQTDLIKVAHHTWIKFLKSRRSSLMMKNDVTYDGYECTKRK